MCHIITFCLNSRRGLKTKVHDYCVACRICQHVNGNSLVLLGEIPVFPTRMVNIHDASWKFANPGCSKTIETSLTLFIPDGVQKDSWHNSESDDKSRSGSHYTKHMVKYMRHCFQCSFCSELRILCKNEN